MIPQIVKILYAIDLAKRYGAKIIILHAVEPIRPYLLDEVPTGVISALKQAEEKERETDIETMRKHLHNFCERAESQLGPPCVELVSRILVSIGHPVEEILKAADEEGCDAMVLGTHGKGFLKQTFLGSVSGSVLKRSRKPVFIIPLPSEKATCVEWDGV